jgi:IPT/TIG domain
VVDLRIVTATAASNPVPFTYQATPVVADLKPNHGPTRGSTLVVVHGGNFVVGQTKVYFGKRQGKDVKVLSSRLMVAKSPAAEQPGTVPVVVTTPDGASCEMPFVFE